MGQEITLTASDGGRFAAYLALPAQLPAPGLVVLPEVFNTNPHIRAVADGYAADGFIALAPDVFWRQEAANYLPYTDEGRAKARALCGRARHRPVRPRPRRHGRRPAGAGGLHRQDRRDGLLPRRQVRLPGEHAPADRGRGELLRRTDRPASRRGRPSQVPAPDAFRRERSACAAADRSGDPGTLRWIEGREIHVYPGTEHGFNRQDIHRTTRRQRRKRGRARSSISAVSCREPRRSCFSSPSFAWGGSR